jgi:hypothetical protein
VCGGGGPCCRQYRVQQSDSTVRQWATGSHDSPCRLHSATAFVPPTLALLDTAAPCTCQCSEANALPTLKVPLAAPADPQKRLYVSLLDSSKQLLATWQQQQQLQFDGQQHLLGFGFPQLTAAAGGSSSRFLGGVAASVPASGSETARCCSTSKQQGCSCSCGAGPCSVPGHCLVFQQPALDASNAGALLQAQVGAGGITLVAQELWVAFPGPGAFHVTV